MESTGIEPSFVEAISDPLSESFASILTSGLLGEVYIGLDAGGDSKMLPDGGKIAKTQSAVILEKLIGQFLFDKAAAGGGK